MPFSKARQLTILLRSGTPTGVPTGGGIRNPRIDKFYEEIKLRSERKAGQFLADMKEQGQLTSGKKSITDNVSTIKLKDIGVEQQESSRWQRIAGVPEIRFEEYPGRSLLPCLVHCARRVQIPPGLEPGILLFKILLVPFQEPLQHHVDGSLQFYH